MKIQTSISCAIHNREDYEHTHLTVENDTSGYRHGDVEITVGNTKIKVNAQLLIKAVLRCSESDANLQTAIGLSRLKG